MIEVSINDSIYEVEVGSTIENILKRANIELCDKYENNPVVAALVNYELLPLSHHLIYEAEIKRSPFILISRKKSIQTQYLLSSLFSRSYFISSKKIKDRAFSWRWILLSFDDDLMLNHK